MTSEQIKNYNTIQLIFEGIIIFGYVVAIIPAWYFFTFWFVIPLAIANLFLATKTENKTLTYAAVNVAMSVVTFIPLLGYIAIVAGIALSIINITQISKLLNINPQKTEPKEKIIDVDSKEKPEVAKKEEVKPEEIKKTEEKSPVEK